MRPQLAILAGSAKDPAWYSSWAADVAENAETIREERQRFGGWQFLGQRQNDGGFFKA